MSPIWRLYLVSVPTPKPILRKISPEEYSTQYVGGVVGMEGIYVTKTAKNDHPQEKNGKLLKSPQGCMTSKFSMPQIENFMEIQKLKNENELNSSFIFGYMLPNLGGNGANELATKQLGFAFWGLQGVRDGYVWPKRQKVRTHRRKIATLSKALFCSCTHTKTFS